MNSLFKHNKISLKQKVFTLLALYELYDRETDSLIGTIKENFTYHSIMGYLPWLHEFKGFDLTLYDLDGNKLQHYRRSIGVNPSVKTFDSEGNLLSQYKAKFFTIRPEIKISDKNGHEIAMVKGNITARELQITTSNGELIFKIHRPFLPPELLKLKYKQLFEIDFRIPTPY